MKSITFIGSIFISTCFFSQEFDKRVLRHYSAEDLANMDTNKLEMVRYYYCDSYTVTPPPSLNFNITDIDIVKYENLRSDTEYVTVEEKNGIIITLIPNSHLKSNLAVKSYFILD